jgi:hypothetical protein
MDSTKAIAPTRSVYFESLLLLLFPSITHLAPCLRERAPESDMEVIPKMLGTSNPLEISRGIKRQHFRLAEINLPKGEITVENFPEWAETIRRELGLHDLLTIRRSPLAYLADNFLGDINPGNYIKIYAEFLPKHGTNHVCHCGTGKCNCPPDCPGRKK